MVVKKDMRREPFNRAKVLDGIMTLARSDGFQSKEWNPLSTRSKSVFVRNRSEVPRSSLARSRHRTPPETDSVAYVRFASVSGVC